MISIGADLLNEQYGIFANRITEQEGDWSARAYKIETNSGTFFLKAYGKQNICYSERVSAAKLQNQNRRIKFLPAEAQNRGYI